MPAVALKLESRQAAITTEIKAAIEEWREADRKRQKLSSRLCELAFTWVEVAIAEGRALTAAVGIQKLASTAKMPFSTIQNWYYLGKYMREHQLTSDKHEHSAILAAWSSSRRITKHEHLRCLDLVRKCRPASEIRRIVAKSVAAHAREAEVRSIKIENEGLLTRTRIRMEMMALKTLAKRFYKDEDVFIHIIRGGKDVEVV